MPVISRPARHNRAARASGFWLLWLRSDLMAVIFISPVLASSSPAAKNTKPAAQKKSRQQQQQQQQQQPTASSQQPAASSHSMCTNNDTSAKTQAPSTKHQAERQEQAGSSSVRPPGGAWLGLAASGFWLLASWPLALHAITEQLAPLASGCSGWRHQIESPRRPPKKSAQGRLPQCQ
jgi:hypothetical protein